MACLCTRLAVASFIRCDHGYWVSAQKMTSLMWMSEVRWAAVRAPQALPLFRTTIGRTNIGGLRQMVRSRLSA